MKKIIAKVEDIINKNIECPLPLEVIPNKMGINLCSVNSIEWTEYDDGQLDTLKICFIPEIDNDNVEMQTDLLPTMENAGVDALNMIEDLVPKLTDQEQAFFVAGFQEAIKILRSALMKNEDYRMSWIANIAMAQLDSERWYREENNKVGKYLSYKDKHAIANKGAEYFISLLTK